MSLVWSLVVTVIQYIIVTKIVTVVTHLILKTELFIRAVFVMAALCYCILNIKKVDIKDKKSAFGL